MAQRLLADSEANGYARYAAYEGRAYCARQHGHNVWHGYPVGWISVPERLRRRWIEEGHIRRRDVRKHWD